MSSGFISILVLTAIHLFSNQQKLIKWIWHGRFLSFASGLSFAYVFVDLLPALEKGQPALRRLFENVIPYFDRHAYLMALFGVLFYYGLHSSLPSGTKRNFWLSMSGYLLFNFFLGASLSDSTNPEVQPLILFTIAMGMHFFVRDHNVYLDEMDIYTHQARWWLVAALFIGYFLGCITRIPDAVVAVVVSFLSGGVLLNVLRYELPKREQIGYIYFVCGSLLYTAIVLGVGDA